MRTKVFLTGASGLWGREVLRQLRDRDDVEVSALVLPTRADEVAMREFFDMRNLALISGDVTDAALVARAVARADVVVHLAAMVSPLADQHPELTWRINVDGTRAIIDAVKALPDPDRVRLIMAGSIAEIGSRNPPHHWGRVGDPVTASRFDIYGQSKIAAERLAIDSGLVNWVWLRQTGLMHAGLVGVRDPIIFCQPLDGVMEWVSVGDAARLIVGLVIEAPPEVFGRVHDVGGGEGWRLTNWEVQTALPAAIGLADPRRWSDRNWYATRNFHGFWFTDSDDLNELVPFRRDTFADLLRELPGEVTGAVRAATRIPPAVLKRVVMRPLARQARGPLHALAHRDERYISALFGSTEAWRQIGDWSTFEPVEPSRTPTYLDHGYDTDASSSTWTAGVLQGAAEFRGGRLITTDARPGGVRDILTWECADGHRFTGSPNLVLSAGHWCPICGADPFDYDRQAEKNRFLAQVL